MISTTHYFLKAVSLQQFLVWGRQVERIFQGPEGWGASNHCGLPLGSTGSPFLSMTSSNSLCPCLYLYLCHIPTHPLIPGVSKLVIFVVFSISFIFSYSSSILVSVIWNWDSWLKKTYKTCKSHMNKTIALYSMFLKKTWVNEEI